MTRNQPQPEPSPSPSPGPGPGPSGPATRFGDGQYIVGTDIAPNRYYTNPSTGCYWERQSGFSGTLGDIIANEFIFDDVAQWIVQILPSDRGFETDSCGTWQLTAPQGMQTNVSAGMWRVGSQVTPGTYRANVISGCYWERLRDFTGQLSGVIANDFVGTGGQQLVTIASSDLGFRTDSECGTWIPLSSLDSVTTSGQPQSRAEIQANRERSRR